MATPLSTKLGDYLTDDNVQAGDLRVTSTTHKDGSSVTYDTLNNFLKAKREADSDTAALSGGFGSIKMCGGNEY